MQQSATTLVYLIIIAFALLVFSMDLFMIEIFFEDLSLTSGNLIKCRQRFTLLSVNGKKLN